MKKQHCTNTKVRAHKRKPKKCKYPRDAKGRLKPKRKCKR